MGRKAVSVWGLLAIAAAERPVVVSRLRPVSDRCFKSDQARVEAGRVMVRIALVLLGLPADRRRAQQARLAGLAEHRSPAARQGGPWSGAKALGAELA